MIPPRLLVYRRTESNANLETLQETWRRKKSCGDLFQNGYRVRQGRPGLEEKERRTGLSHSVWSCLCLLCNWGKGVLCSLLSVRALTQHHTTVKVSETWWLLQTLSLRCVGPRAQISEEFRCSSCELVHGGKRRRSTESVALCKKKKKRQAGRSSHCSAL